MGIVSLVRNIFFKKSDLEFVFNYTDGAFCIIQQNLNETASDLTPNQLVRCYLEYLNRALHAMPDFVVPPVRTAFEIAMKQNDDYEAITRSIFELVFKFGLSPTLQKLELEFGRPQYPGSYSKSPIDSKILWRHRLKMDLAPIRYVKFYCYGGPSQILLPISCGLFYGYIIDQINDEMKLILREEISSIFSKVKILNDKVDILFILEISKYLELRFEGT